MCSLPGILSYTHLLFYYLLFPLFLQYVNEPFASASTAPLCGTARSTTVQCIRQRDNRSAPSVAAVTCFNFSILIDLVWSTSPLVKPCGLSLPCGEYRIRTDDPLLAKQVL